MTSVIHRNSISGFCPAPSQIGGIDQINQLSFASFIFDVTDFGDKCI
jgi:hypothetical protein